MAKRKKKAYQAPEIKVDELPLAELDEVAGGFGIGGRGDTDKGPSSQGSGSPVDH